MPQRVWESGVSEGQFVMNCIAIKTQEVGVNTEGVYIIVCRKTADFRQTLGAKKIRRRFILNKIRKHMDTPFDIPKCYLLGGCNASDAASKLWHYVDWAKVIHAVKSLQIRLAQAASGLPLTQPRPPNGNR